MMYLSVPWRHVAAGTELIAPDGQIWYVVDTHAPALDPYHILVLVEMMKGGPRRELKAPLNGSASVVVRELADAVELILRLMPGSYVSGVKDIGTPGNLTWRCPMPNTSRAGVEELREHVRLFHGTSPEHMDGLQPAALFRAHAHVHGHGEGAIGSSGRMVVHHEHR